MQQKTGEVFVSDEELIDNLLKDTGFQKRVEDDIGQLVSPARVDWPKNIISFYGTKAAKQIKIDETLSVLKNEIH